MEGYLPYLLRPPEVKQVPAIPEKEEKKEVKCLENASKELSARLKNTLERQGIHPRYIDEVKIYVPIGSDVDPNITIDELIKEHQSKNMAIYKGGIGTGIKGNDTELKDPKGAGNRAISALKKNAAEVSEEILRRMKKEELTGNSVNFLARANYGIIIDIVPPDDDGIEHLSSLKADAKLLMELMRGLRTKEREKKPDLFFFSNGGYKFFQHMLAGFIKTSEDLRTIKNTYLDTTAKEQLLMVKQAKSLKEVKKNVIHREEETADSWDNGYDFVDFLETINGGKIFISGAPEGIESITFPFNPADKNVLTRLIKLTGVAGMRLAVRSLSRVSLTTPIDALLTKNILPHDLALMASRLIEMAHFTTRDLEKMDNTSLLITSKVMARFCNKLTIECVINKPDLEVVDSTDSKVPEILDLIFPGKVGVTETDVSVFYRDKADEARHTSAIKEPGAVEVLQLISAMRKLRVFREPPKAGSHTVLTARYRPCEISPSGIDEFGSMSRKLLAIDIDRLTQIINFPKDEEEKKISTLFENQRLAVNKHTNETNPLKLILEQFLERTIPFVAEDNSDLHQHIIEPK